MEHTLFRLRQLARRAFWWASTTTAAYCFRRLRQLIHQANEDDAPFSGEVEADESYLGGQRKRLRGRGATGKVPVFHPVKSQRHGLCQDD